MQLAVKNLGKQYKSDFWGLKDFSLDIKPGILHSNIGSAPQKRGECTVGWIAHYMIGVTFAIGFVTYTGSNWLQYPMLIPALIFGLVSISMPFFIMQPALGLGIAASKTSNPLQARVRTLMNHIVFHIGLYLVAILTNWLLY